MADTIRCQDGHENPLGKNFCRECGKPLKGGTVQCKHCGMVNDSAARFCGSCGKPPVGESAPNMRGMVWRRNPDDFATRLDIQDLETTFRGGVIVEQGTKALLLKDGALWATLQPGRYELKTFLEAVRDSSVSGVGKVVGGIAGFLIPKSGQSIDKIIDSLVTQGSTVILIDSGDVELQMHLTDIYTKDPIKIDITCKLVVQLDNATLFFNNVMKGRISYPLSELKGNLFEELKNAFNDNINKKTVSELNYDLSLKKQFEASVEHHLKATFSRNGLAFIQLRTMDYIFQHFDKIRGIQEQTFLQISEEEAELYKRKRLFDVYDRTQLQDIIEETKEVEYRQKRQQVWADMRKLINSDKMNEIKSADDLEGYLHEINKGKFLREDEINALKNSFIQSGLQREFLLKKIELEQRLEYERLNKVGAAANELAEYEEKAKLERLKFETELKVRAANRAEQVENAKAGATIAEMERDGRKKDMDLEHEANKRDMDMSLSALERIKALKEREKRTEAELELAKQKALAEAEIEKTRVYQQMDSEQLLVLMSRGDANVAAALKQKFEGMGTAEKEKLMREMMADKDKTHEATLKMMQEMFNKSLETQKEVSIAATHSGQPNILYPPYGQPFAGPMSGVNPNQQNVNIMAARETPKVVICPKCKLEVPTGQKYCSNCGHEMF